jgi:outer membrane lipoprotein SlyB
MNTSKKRVLTEQVRRLRARFAQSVDTLLGDVIPGEFAETVGVGRGRSVAGTAVWSAEDTGAVY